MTAYQVQVRPTPAVGEDLPWGEIQEYPYDAASAVLDELLPGVSYDVRMRTREEDGALSDWWTRTGVLLERDPAEPLPLPPTEAHLTKDGCLWWKPGAHEQRDHRYLIRHLPAPWRRWKLGERAHEGVCAGPPFILCRVPKGRRTLLIRTVDDTGAESATEAVVQVHRGEFDDRREFHVRTVDEKALGFPGTKIGCTVSGGNLVASIFGPTLPDRPFWSVLREPFWTDMEAPFWPDDLSTPFWGPTFGNDAPFWPDDLSTPFWQDTYRWIAYVWDFDVGTEEAGPRSSLSVDVVTDSDLPWRLEYRRRLPDPFWPENVKEPFWPADMSTPFWPQPEGHYLPWPGRVDHLEAGGYRFRLIVPSGWSPASVTALATTVSSEARVVQLGALQVPAGGVRLPIEEPFGEVLDLRLVAVQEGATVQIIDRDRTNGPRIAIVDGAGNGIAGEVIGPVRGR